MHISLSEIDQIQFIKTNITMKLQNLVDRILDRVGRLLKVLLQIAKGLSEGELSVSFFWVLTHAHTHILIYTPIHIYLYVYIYIYIYIHININLHRDRQIDR